jgi:predicted nucleotidyltransferase component of viral defense system
MINPETLKKYFPPYLSEKSSFMKYMMKEYIQLLILDYLTTTPFIQKIVLIGGTNLRLIKGIDRFSEDLDFDSKELSEAEFIKMTDGILRFLQRNGYHVITKDKKSEKLIAFRRNIYFPEFLFNLNLSAYKNERFLIKVEAQDQGVEYSPVMAKVKGCGFFFSFPVPPDPVLCAMKISALLSRQKGRDFYDVMFLMQNCEPDYRFLQEKCGIYNRTELDKTMKDLLKSVDLNSRVKDFQHLVFQERNSRKIILFEDFVIRRQDQSANYAN